MIAENYNNISKKVSLKESKVDDIETKIRAFLKNPKELKNSLFKKSDAGNFTDEEIKKVASIFSTKIKYDETQILSLLILAKEGLLI